MKMLMVKTVQREQPLRVRGLRALDCIVLPGGRFPAASANAGEGHRGCRAQQFVAQAALAGHAWLGKRVSLRRHRWRQVSL